MKNNKNKLVLKGVFYNFPTYTTDRIYDKEVFKREVEKISLNVDVKPRIESAIEGGYIDKILDMIDEELIDNYIRRKKNRKNTKNIKTWEKVLKH